MWWHSNVCHVRFSGYGLSAGVGSSWLQLTPVDSHHWRYHHEYEMVDMDEMDKMNEMDGWNGPLSHGICRSQTASHI